MEAAQTYLDVDAQPTAVRPAPQPGGTTRVMYSDDTLAEGETRAVFLDPATGEVRGDLTVYGTSGAVPLRGWIDHLHRNLHLGDTGRLYSELSASWLGVIAVAGLGLWIRRARRSRRRRDLVRPKLRARGYRRTLSLHSSAGIWVLLGALFLAATGITWSQYGGGNIGTVREAFGFTTQAVSPSLPAATGETGSAAASDGHGEHAEHSEKSTGDGHASHGHPARPRPAATRRTAPIRRRSTMCSPQVRRSASTPAWSRSSRRPTRTPPGWCRRSSAAIRRRSTSSPSTAPL